MPCRRRGRAAAPRRAPRVAVFARQLRHRQLLLLRKASLLQHDLGPPTYADLRTLIRKERPDIAHCHNLLAVRSARPPTMPANLPEYRWCRRCTTIVCSVRRAPCSQGRRCRILHSWPYAGRRPRLLSPVANTNRCRFADAAHASTARDLEEGRRCLSNVPAVLSQASSFRLDFPRKRSTLSPISWMHDPGQRTDGATTLFSRQAQPAEKGVLEMIVGVAASSGGIAFADRRRRPALRRSVRHVRRSAKPSYQAAGTASTHNRRWHT